MTSKATKKLKKEMNLPRKKPNEVHEYLTCHTCDNCDKEIMSRSAWVGPEGVPVIHYQMLGQADFYCEACDITWAYGDFEYINVADL